MSTEVISMNNTHRYLFYQTISEKTVNLPTASFSAPIFLPTKPKYAKFE